LHFLQVNGESTFNEPKGEFLLVDLPGVGYAKVPKKLREEWAKFMADYFYTRPTLKVPRQKLSLNLLAFPTRSLPGPCCFFLLVHGLFSQVVFHLVDSRHGPVAADEELMRLVAKCPRPLTYVIVLTKADKKDSAAAEKSLGLKRSVESVRAKLAENGLSPTATPVLLTSSVSRLGRDHMWRFLRLAADPAAFEP
jgi:GTP-binding protein EngB required for normal cell division